ncbi:MAG TPA: hypothetical protein VG325_15305 [Solirubrobacteraceae bacterium]|jgi:hypothetical protein|nr:hypothetical protein [Solirubrobacteraceae bacterium]
MATILILNAASTLIAGTGIGGFLVWRDRRTRENPPVQPIFLSADDD